MLRWLIMATGSGACVCCVAAQLLQGITATGAILGIMLVIATRVPVQSQRRSAGAECRPARRVVFAVTTAGSGLLWSYGVSFAYLAMAGIAALGIVLAWPSRTSEPGDVERSHRPIPMIRRSERMIRMTLRLAILAGLAARRRLRRPRRHRSKIS